MTASNYISHISGIMDAVHAHLKFKLSALIIALSTVMNNVSHHRRIPVEIYSFVSNTLRENFNTQSRLGNAQSVEKKMTFHHENVVICQTLHHLQRPLILVTNV
jgi:hypothetical protein